MSRQFAILNFNKIDIDKNIISKINNEIITIFSEKEYPQEFVDSMKNITTSKVIFKIFPDSCKNLASRTNYILKTVSKDDGELVHIIHDRVRIKNDMTQFLSDIENIMHIFDLESWFNTTTDGMNYVYAKYMTRVKLRNDLEEFKNLNIKDIYYTSHANDLYSIYNLNKIKDDILDSRFSIPMYYIIEYLARRRNESRSKLSINFMNMYPTTSSEYGTFDVVRGFEPQITPELNRTEDELFKTLNIDYSPDNNVDVIIENTYNILKSKVG